jgi:uncharacterized membrane protein YidH (DUF202 family)
MTAPDDSAAAPDLEERDPGLARERTALSWTRTALSFAALGAIIAKEDVVPGLIVLCIAPAIWLLGQASVQRKVRFEVITATIVGLSVVALVVALLSNGKSLGIH